MALADDITQNLDPGANSTGQGVGDFLAAVAGHPVNRRVLNMLPVQAAVQSQATQAETNLRNAQTQSAVQTAMDEQQKAIGAQNDNIQKSNFRSAYLQAHPTATDADLMTAVTTGGLGSNFQAAATGQGDIQTQQNKAILGDTTGKYSQADKFAAAQALQGKLENPLMTAPAEGINVSGAPVKTQLDQTGAADVNAKNATASEAIEKANQLHAMNNGAGGLTPGALDLAVDDTMAVPGHVSLYAGMGGNGQQMKTLLANGRATKLAAAGMTDSDLIKQQALAKAAASSAPAAAKQVQTLDSFIPLVKNNAAAAKQLLANLPDYDIPLADAVQRSASRGVGGVDATTLQSVATTYQNEVARLLASGPTMNGVISDAARNEIGKMANIGSMTRRQAEAVMSRIDIELNTRRGAAMDALLNNANMQAGVGTKNGTEDALAAGGGNTPPPASTVTPPVGDAGIPASAVAQLHEGVHTTFGNSQVWTLQDGKPVQIQPQGK